MAKIDTPPAPRTKTEPPSSRPPYSTMETHGVSAAMGSVAASSSVRVAGPADHMAAERGEALPT